MADGQIPSFEDVKRHVVAALIPCLTLSKPIRVRRFFQSLDDDVLRFIAHGVSNPEHKAKHYDDWYLTLTHLTVHLHGLIHGLEEPFSENTVIQGTSPCAMLCLAEYSRRLGFVDHVRYPKDIFDAEDGMGWHLHSFEEIARIYQMDTKEAH